MKKLSYSEGKRLDYLNGLDKDCITCIHMKHDECEYGNEYTVCENCEDWEER